MVNFKRGSGRLSTDRFDFQNHIDGYDFRHNADGIDVLPPISFRATDYNNLYDLLYAVSGFVSNFTGTFLSVGDGYDTYKNYLIDPNNPYDGSVPAFNFYLDDLLNNTSNPLHDRIKNGGVIVIKSGTYKFIDTVNVPAGITIVGEGFGTKIINAISTPKPLFKIKANATRLEDNIDSINGRFMFSKETKFVDLTIADNFIQPRFLGDTAYLTPKNTATATPTALVSVEEGCHFSCEYVKFIGKTTYSGSVLTNVSAYAIATDSTIPSTTGTIINVKNCFIDGFAVPVRTTTSTGVLDYLNFENNYVRAYGYLNSDFVNPENNCVLRLSAANINASNNFILGYDTTVALFVYIESAIAGSVPLQSYSRILITNNNFTVDRGDTSVNNTFLFLGFNPSITNVSSKLTSLLFGNNFRNDNVFSITANSNRPRFLVDQYGVGFYGAVRYNPLTITTTPYTVDSDIYPDVLLFVDTSSAKTINLPAHSSATAGRKIIIKDIYGLASTNNITLSRNGGTGNIEGLAANYILNTDYGSWTIVSNGVDSWWFI